MGTLDKEVAVVSGAGRGIGREHALLLAAEGAAVVVDDVGGGWEGTGGAATTAERVADEIRAAGGRAVANADDIGDTAGAQRIIDSAIAEFGRLDILINNAGILRDRVLVNLTDDDWDLVVRVNLRGTFLMMRAAANHWRERSKAGEEVRAAVVNTSSESGVFGNPGQANYAAAKAAVASLTQVASKELARYGGRVNAILPQARTRLTESAFGDALAAKDGFDRWDPANVSPFVVYLAGPACPISGEVFVVGGSRVQRLRGWERDPGWKLQTQRRCTVADLEKAVAGAGVPEGQMWTANPGKGGR